MFRKLLLLAFILVGISATIEAQRITYSEPERDDYKSTEFEIIGRISGNILVYKSYRGEYNISVYDKDMKLINKVALDFLPKKLLSMDFISYPDRAYMVYQFQRRDAVYSFVGLIDSNGNFKDAPLLIDSTRVTSNSRESNIYSLEVSEDKNRIFVYKINQDREDNHVFYTFLYDQNFNLITNSRVSLPMESRRKFLSNFHLTNEGDFVFNKLERTSNRDYTVNGSVVIKQALVDSLETIPFEMPEVLLDEVRVKLDNVRKEALVTAFSYKQRRGNVDGLYLMRFDLISKKKVFEKAVVFSDDLKQQAKGQSSMSAAFNDYFIKKIVNTKEGGVIITAESYYTSSRSNPWNRWNYLYGYPTGGYGFGGYNPYYMSPYSPYYYNPFGYGDRTGTRYHYDNIAILAFDANGEFQYSNFINKQQFDDGNDIYLGFMTVNIGSELRFLYNTLDRRQQLLTDNSISPDGKINRKPTLRNLDKGFNWMPRYGKQISGRSVIIPTIYRNYICFAKIDF
jgi:hypothetical protein